MAYKDETVHYFTYRLSSVDIGADGRAKPSALANALQEAAREHAQHLGWGVETLHEKMQYWVLSRIHVEILERPKYGSVLTVKTWPKGGAGLFAWRDFEMEYDGRVILKATSSWALLDAKTGRPTSVDVLSDLFSDRADQHAISTPAEKIPVIKEEFSSVDITPTFTDLDEIRHVNNTKYLDWAWSAISPEQRKVTQGWTVNYLKEVKEGEKLQLRVGPIEGMVSCEGTLISGKHAFTVAFHLPQA